MLKVFDFEKTPIVDIVNEILVDASSRGASDIHFDPKDNILQIRIRIDGELVDYATVPEEYIKNLITRIKIISGMNITESRLPQDGAIKGVVKDIELDLRVSSINTNKGEKIVIRILDYTLSLNGIENLGFSDYNYKRVIEMISKQNGIILVTGATGTGKTTTVYSMLQKLSNDTTNIMSIEDPVEMDLDNVNQIQVNADIGLTFATALRSILRQDPNIIMIGEIRDSETATIAIRASVTGHLVLSTLHTNDSLSTIERLMDMDVEKYLLAEALEGIISQRLARRLCPHCKKLRKTTTYEKELIKKTLNIDVDEIYEAVGCEHCNRGYKGRIAFQEVLTIDQKIQDALSMNIRKDKLRNLVYNNSVVTLLQDGMIKVVRGDTTIEELLRLVEFEEDNIITFNLSKDILDSELNKSLEFHDDTKKLINDESQDNDIIEEEIIIPDTHDVVIDSINDEDIDDNTDIDNMDSLDNDQEFIDKIDDVISDQVEDKESKLKKNKKEPTEENEEINNDNIVNEKIIEDNINEVNISDNENMESLDNSEEVIDKIDDVVSEQIEDKKDKHKKKKKDKNKKELTEEIEEINVNEDNTESNNSIDNMESLDNDQEFIDKIDDIISEQVDNKKDKHHIEEVEMLDNDEIIVNEDNTESNNFIDNMESLDSNEEVIDKINDVVSEQVDNKKTKHKKKDKKKKHKEKKKESDKINIDNNKNYEYEDFNNIQPDMHQNDHEMIDEKEIKPKKKDRKNKNIVKDSNESEISLISDTLIDTALDEVKSEVKDDVNKQDLSNDNINIDDDSTFITKVENYVKEKRKKNENSADIDIIDELSENTNIEDINANSNNDIQEEITDNDIAELEEAIESIKVNENETVENNEDISNNEVLENTIKISINDDSDEINVSEVKTINMAPKDSDEMDLLDYNTDFIDKIYDSINNNEKRIIEKNNIDYEKIERLENIQDSIENRVSRMLNKKRYRKKKSE